MKKLALLLLFLFFQNVQSQNENLFITFDSGCPLHKMVSKNKTTIIEKYSIEFDNGERPHYKFSTDENGQLKNEIQISGATNGSLNFSYLNYKNQNAEVTFKAEDMRNIIKCSELPYSKETNFTELFSKFKNIYFVAISKKLKNYKAKKVKFIEYYTL
jgi:hypothetical protein